MFDLDSALIDGVLLILGLLAILLPVCGNKFNEPSFLVLGRWFRWVLVASVFSVCLRHFELSFRPDWVHLITGFALWFLLETGYNWLSISAISRSELPLFPKFEVNKDGDEWPADERLIKTKEWLHNENFKRLGAFKAELFDGMYLRSSVYESADRLTRIQILFVPTRRDEAKACFTLSNQGAHGDRIITDNLHMPYGGYYPESWNLCRKPLISSLSKLLSLHRKRVVNSSIESESYVEDVFEEINENQRLLERLNTESGFLVPYSMQSDEGRISYNGRYRLWKEMWLLAYLGRSVS